jgi:hypothetical protein
MSPRWVGALLKRMKFEGDRAVVHRSRGRPSNRKLPTGMKQRAKPHEGGFADVFNMDTQHMLPSLARWLVEHASRR